jgi:hypothetical protein
MRLGLIASSAKTTAESIRGSAAAIAYNGSTFHVGCYYRDPETQTVVLLDLREDCCVYRSKPSDAFLWRVPSLPFQDLKLVASHCAAIYEKYKGVGLTFVLSYRARFAQDYSLTVEGPAAGFTCATFVLAIFERAGIRLLDTETWPSRPEDTAWQVHVRDYLSRILAPQQLVEQVTQDIGCVRYRPEEVVAATTFSRYPVSFKKVGPIAKQIASYVKGLNRVLRPVRPPELPA